MRKRESKPKWVIVLTSTILFCILACSLGQSLDIGNEKGNSIPLNTGDSNLLTDEGASQVETDLERLSFTLTDGQPKPQEVDFINQVAGEPLSESEIKAILARLPDLSEEPEDKVDFRLPEISLPPPRTGETVEVPFPAPQEDPGSEAQDYGPLEVLRYSPEGEIPIAPFVNVTFNQPMVPLTTVEDLSTEDVPVIIEPQLQGTWRWLGTKTLNFQYDSELIDRIPMATEYTVTIPAGITSEVGGELGDTIQFTFRTPPPTLQRYHPTHDPQPINPLFFLAFDQRIDPQAVLDTIQVLANGEYVEIKLASNKDVEADKAVSRLVEQNGEGRWLVFRALEDLPKDSNINVTVGPGTPSAEGPLTTETPQSFSFQTYAPLKINRHGCYWNDDDCRPLVPFFIEFNNPIDSNLYEEGWIKIEPELPGASVNIVGNTVQIRGASKGQTTYRVTVDQRIQDIFGQTLGEDIELKFRVGRADPVLIGPGSNFVTLDPASQKPALSLYTINYSRLDVKIYAVEPSDWEAFKEYLREYQRTNKDLTPPGRLVLNDVQRLETPTDTLTEVGIDLSEVMEGEFGHFIVIAKPPKGLFQEDRYWETVQTWVQITKIGLDAFVDHSEIIAWTSNLQNGFPLEGVKIESDTGVVLGTTGTDGVLKFDIPRGGTKYLVARQGNDLAFLPPSQHFWNDTGFTQQTVNDQLRWYVFDDRQMYRPGEEVHVKGWIRLIGGLQDGDVGLAGKALKGVFYKVIDPQGNELLSDRVEANALGGFHFAFNIPDNSNLGFAYIELQAEGSFSGIDGTWNSHNFQIQEFRRPEFEVAARNETTGPYFVGDSATLAVEAKYFAGGPLPNAEVNWWVRSTPTNYKPPNWPDFSFGIWQPWWWYFGGNNDESQSKTFAGRTDPTGNHYLNIEFEEVQSLRPFSIEAEATVIDVNRQAWTGRTTLLVHPANLYVGLRSELYFVERGEPLEIELIVTDLDGGPVTDRLILVTAARLEWKFKDGNWDYEEVDSQECSIGSTNEPVLCSFETNLGGRYQITAKVTDDLGRENKSQITRWVSGGQQPPSREVEKETLNLIPNKELFQPGDKAEILVQSPFGPSEGLMTVSRSGILYTERFRIDKGSATLEIPILAEYIPNINVQVDLVGSSPRTDDQGDEIQDAPERPAFASGTLTINIPPLERTLDLEVKPEENALEPGGQTSLNVRLSDSEGNPVPNAELAVVVVDEAILALTNYQLADPVMVFYSTRPSYLNSYYSRENIVLTDPQAFVNAADQAKDLSLQAVDVVEEAEMMVEMEAAPAEAPVARGLADGDEQAGPEPIRVRSDFNPLATFAPEVSTNSNGEAQIDINLPDNLTRYRVMIVAVDSAGNKFGSGEANITARLPLMVRPASPRFLNFGDTFEMPVVLQNQTKESMLVDVIIQATNLSLTGNLGVQVNVPANDRIEVRFPAEADMAGTARFLIAGVSGSYADAAQGDLPVFTPATTEAFATYGVVDEGTIAQPVASPENVFTQFGGLEIQTSSTALQALTDAVIYLVSYPYECSEQLASRILGVAALRDVLAAFEADGLPSPDAMVSAIERDIETLRGLQNWNGGFPWWRRGQDSIPFASIHVAHALQMAKIKGFEVPSEMQQQVLFYLQEIESHYPAWYSLRTRQTLSAYALYVRDLMGDSDPEKARKLLKDAGLENLSMEAVGWIWSALVDKPNSDDEIDTIRRHINNRVVETAGAANFTTSYDDQTYLLLGSNRRTDAILLHTLIADNPDSDLIPKLVNGLLGHRVKGRWNNTQENVFVLLALDRYFNTFESQTPDFVARIWLGDTYAGDHEYVGRTTERHETQIPMNYLVDPEFGGGDTQDLVISKDGHGRLYYRLGLRYAPTDLWLDPLDMGFVVQRVYEAVDNTEDVYKDEEGVWHIKAGARVRVRITMVADNRRYHVALVDPLPAGLEIVNPALAVTGSTPQDPNSEDYRYGWWWYWPWYEHQNMKDEAAEAFTPLLWDGVYEYTYIARATTPGTFVTPPAKAEEMYSPEVFGRSASDWVIVE